MLIIQGKAQCACSIIAYFFAIDGGNGLDLLKIWNSIFLFIGIDINEAFPLMYNVNETSILGNFNMSGSGFQLTVDHIC